jgi:hypothetical protein
VGSKLSECARMGILVWVVHAKRSKCVIDICRFVSTVGSHENQAKIIYNYF